MLTDKPGQAPRWAATKIGHLVRHAVEPSGPGGQPELAVFARSEPNVTPTGIASAPCRTPGGGDSSSALAVAFEASDPVERLIERLKCACRSR